MAQDTRRRGLDIRGFGTSLAGGGGFKLPRLRTPQKLQGQQAASITGVPSNIRIGQGDVRKGTALGVPAPLPVTAQPSPTQPAPIGQQAAVAPPVAPPTIPPVTPQVTPPVTPPTPTPFQPSPQDAQLQALRQQFLGTLAPTTEEQQIQQRLAGIVTGEERGAEAIRTQAIPTPLLRGQAAALERQVGIQAAPLQRQLGLLQQQRQAEAQRAETELGFRKTDVEREEEQREEFERGTREEAIAGLVTQGVTDAAQLSGLLPGVSVDEISETLESLGVQKPEAPEPFTLAPGQMRFDAQGNIVATGGPRLRTETEIGKALERQEKDVAARSSQIDAIATVNEILGSEDLETVTGTSRLGIRARTAGTASVRGALSRLKGLTSLEGRNKLKGTGTISDFEAGMLANSANSLNFAIDDDGKVAMSDAEVQQNLKNIRGVLLAKTGEPVTIIATDPNTGESRILENQTRENIEDAALQGFIVDYQ